MRLTTKGRYAVTAMLDLALNADKGAISLADIARRQEISLPYLEQLFALAQSFAISFRPEIGAFADSFGRLDDDDLTAVRRVPELGQGSETRADRRRRIADRHDHGNQGTRGHRSARHSR